MGREFLRRAEGSRVPESGAQTPPSAGIAEGRPAPKTQADTEAAESEAKPEQFAIPVQAIEEPENSEDAERREEKERRAEEREQADLEAQRGMAKSARELLSPAWWQVWIAGAGAVLLGLSLIFSAVAAHAAAKAASAAQEVLKAERAWLTDSGFEIEHLTKATIDGVVHREANGLRSSGLTLAALLPFALTLTAISSPQYLLTTFPSLKNHPQEKRAALLGPLLP